MSRSFGSIMAEVAQNHLAMKQRGAPTCPLCGAPMEGHGDPWFCYGGRNEHRRWLESRRLAAFEYQQGGGVVFYRDLDTPARYRSQNWDPDMQGVILAVAEINGIRFFFDAVRGENGVTNFRVTTDPAAEEINKFPAANDWQWAEWTKQGE